MANLYLSWQNSWKRKLNLTKKPFQPYLSNLVVPEGNRNKCVVHFCVKSVRHVCIYQRSEMNPYWVVEGDAVLFEEWYRHVMTPGCRITWAAKKNWNRHNPHIRRMRKWRGAVTGEVQWSSQNKLHFLSFTCTVSRCFCMNRTILSKNI